MTESAPEDDARRIILARRARFVAAALASAGIATASCGGETSGGEEGTPQPCLGAYADGGQYNDAGTGTGTGGPLTGAGGMPQPCLDAAPSAAGGAGISDAAVPDPGLPMACLRIPASDRGENAGS